MASLRSRLGRHGAHGAQLLQLAQGLFPGLLGQLGLLDRLFQLGQLVTAVLGFAELLLDRLQLLVQVILALGLLHLALDPAADALFHLEHADLALHEGKDLLQAIAHLNALQELLLLRDLEGEMGGHRVRQLAGIVDLIDRNQHLGRDLLVELDVLLELGDHRAAERIQLALVALAVLGDLPVGLEELRVVGELDDAGPLAALDQHLHGAVRQLEELEHGAHRADRKDVRRRRIVLPGVLLGDQKDLLVVLHHVFQGAHGFLAPDEKRHDHVRKDHDVAQRKDWVEIATGYF
jgi:hypothetical protein